MAGRKNRIGLDYFSLECTFEKDDIELIEAKCGLVAFAVIVKLWQKIYRNGYFIKFDDDNMMLFSRKIMHPVDEIEKIIQECFKRNLFDEGLYLKYKILTGEGVQSRYFEACKICKRKSIYINPELILINPETMDINSEIIHENTELIPQSKVKESKVKKRKETTFGDFEKSPSLDFDPDFDFSQGELFKGEHVVKTENEKAESFFEEKWKLYPKKVGKNDVSITAKKKLLKKGDEIDRAIERYISFLESEKWKGFNRSPMDGRRFFTSGYEDYLDGNYSEEDHQEEEIKTLYHPDNAYLLEELEKAGIRR